MKNNLKNELKDNYAIIPNDLIRDNSMSDRARFIFCLLASKPNDWVFYNKALARELNYSVDTLRKYINELILKGWLEKIQNAFKANDYILKATNSTASEKTRHGKNPTPENSNTYKEIPTQRNTINKEIIFNQWWDLYDKKVNKLDAKKKFFSLPFTTINKILNHTPLYVGSTPDKKFRKDPIRYLTKKVWEDEILSDSKSTILHVPA